jgi:hypothetical protein
MSPPVSWVANRERTTHGRGAPTNGAAALLAVYPRRLSRTSTIPAW